eukprot:COSAG02_NODE_3500_length_6650_cov_4.876355_3_plen_684_part_00
MRSSVPLGATSPTAARRMAAFESMDGGHATVHQITALFNSVADGEGMVDRGGLATAMQKLSLPYEPARIEEYFTEIAEAGAVAISLEQFVPWFQARGDWSFAPGGSTQGFKKAGTSVKSVGKKVLKPAAKLKAAIMGGDDARSARGVAPESMFLIDQNGNSDMREQADLRGHLHLRYESEFQHLRDLIVGQEDDSTYQEAFDEANAELFDEGSAEKALGWPADCIQAAKRVFTRKEQLNLWRHFVQSGPELDAKAGTLLSWQNNRDSATSAPTPEAAERTAYAFLNSADGSIEGIVNKETLPFEQALQAVRDALQQELAARRSKVSELEQRLRDMRAHADQNQNSMAPPRKLRFSGLRGEAAAANGTYCAEGLRCYWGRPLYARMLDSGGDPTVPYFLFFTKTYQPGEALADGSISAGKWSDGVWVLGPTLNSERCTAYLEESGEHDMLYPVSTKTLAADKERYAMKLWNVFDVVAKSWGEAPGRHCPSFSVEVFEEPGNSLTEYVEAAVDQQKQSAQQFEGMVEDEAEQETLRLTLKGYVDPSGNISRGAFLSWRKSVYKDEIQDKQMQLRDVILVDQTLSLAGTDDERKHTVDDIINGFVWQVQKEMAARQVAKRKFFARISRPSLSRAFFTWKFACRQSSMAAMPSSGLFTEPLLPWNVRHPRSRFTTRRLERCKITQAL